jgi:hypothetical protein
VFCAASASAFAHMVYSASHESQLEKVLVEGDSRSYPPARRPHCRCNYLRCQARSQGLQQGLKTWGAWNPLVLLGSLKFFSRARTARFLRGILYTCLVVSVDVGECAAAHPSPTLRHTRILTSVYMRVRGCVCTSNKGQKQKKRIVIPPWNPSQFPDPTT